MGVNEAASLTEWGFPIREGPEEVGRPPQLPQGSSLPFSGFFRFVCLALAGDPAPANGFAKGHSFTWRLLFGTSCP